MSDSNLTHSSNSVGGMGRHQKHGNAFNVWLTPPEIVEALGPFDLDPCFSEPRPWATAKEHYGIDSGEGVGGLRLPWNGLVWCNPPYDRAAGNWLKKCADHGDAIALIFARTETKDFHSQVWARADAVFFFKGRLTFCKSDGTRAKANGGAPSALVCYGSRAVDRVRSAGFDGRLIHLKN